MGKTSKKGKSLDSRPSLSLGKEAKESSRLGLLLAFFTIIFIAFMGILICIKTFGRHKPSWIQYELPPQAYNQKLQWNTDDFNFGLSIVKIADYQNAVVTYEYEYRDWDSNEGAIDLKMNEDCQFGILPGKVFNCFYQAEETKDKTYLDAAGPWNFIISYHSCFEDNPNGYGCINEDSVNAILNDKPQATLVYQDVVIDPDNYKDPIRTVENYVNARIDIGSTLFVELNEVEFISDNGWVFEDLKTITKLKATTSLKAENQDMLSVQLIYGGKKTVYKRTYPKIQDFFAHISGFLTIITPLFFLLISQHGNRKAIQHMINEVYEIKLKKPNKGGDSPQTQLGKTKSKSSRSIVLPTSLPTTGAATERNLLSSEAISKFKNRARPTEFNQKGIPFPPHAALVIGCLDKLAQLESPEKIPTKDDISQIPEENIEPFRFDSFEKAPSSPLKSTLVSPRHDESKLLTSALTTSIVNQLPKKPENERLNENLEPVETRRGIGNRSLAEEESESEEEEEEVPLRTSDPLKVPWKDWLKAFWKPSAEVKVMNKAKEHIMQTFDLATLSKKVSEIDKLKACLLTQEQRVIFENLPSSVIVLNPNVDINKPEAIKQYNWNKSFKGDEEAIRKAYSKLKETKNDLNKLLIKFYESENICDGLAS